MLNSKLHLSMHGKGYNNKLIKILLGSNGRRIRRQPMFLIGFLTGVMTKLGFEDVLLVP